jgi:deoxyuridine 5'-triphosphate nucleotidohydrolase
MPYYVLNVCISAGPEAKKLTELYAQQILDREKKFVAADKQMWDAGFDLYSPLGALSILKGGSLKADMGVVCTMDFYEGYTPYQPVGFFLYPRSSLGLSPLRLANSVGVIDAGYRGHLIALLDNISPEPYVLQPYQRLVQIVCPNITYPMHVRLVKSHDTSERGTKGFGSSGL